MKKINTKLVDFIFVAVMLICFGSCTPEVSDVFNDSSANRIANTLKEDKAILQSAENGWIMKYYPSSTQMYGGYNVLVKFTSDGKATVASEIYGGSKTATSNYSIEQSAGPVLTFNEYNEVMHFFSNPVNPLDIGNKGKGMQGDFEFTIRARSEAH